LLTKKNDINFNKIPKVELHLHMEGAIPLHILLKSIKKSGREPVIKNLDDLKSKFVYRDFSHFIELWTWKNSFVEKVEDFEEISYEVLRELSLQNVAYVEATYSPGDYWRQGLSVQGITENIIKGKGSAFKDFNIRCELICDLIRDHGPELGLRYLNEVTPYLGMGVIGIGLGGTEELFPCEFYENVFREARDRGFRITVHAGETAGPESIRSAIEKLGAQRIGHGTRAIEDPGLVSFLKVNGIPLEICIVSNVGTGVVANVESHPIKDYYHQNLRVTVNSDDPVMFDTTTSAEYRMLAERLGFSINDLRKVSLNGVKASFLGEEEKSRLMRTFEKEWDSIIRKHQQAIS